MQQVSKFLLLGVLSTIIDYGVYSFLIILGLDYVLAIFIGYGLGLLANYYIGRRYIFTSGTKMTSTHKEFMAVVGIAIIGMLLNVVIVKLLSFTLMQMDPLYSRIIAIVLVFFWNYFLRKIFVYH